MSSEKRNPLRSLQSVKTDSQQVTQKKAPWSSPELKDLGDVVEETKLGFGGSSDGPGQS